MAPRRKMSYTDADSMRRDVRFMRRYAQRRQGRLARLGRGYLMTAGALVTLYGLVRLTVWLLVEIGKWMP